MSETRRERLRATTISEIKEIARLHMAENGAGAFFSTEAARLEND